MSKILGLDLGTNSIGWAVVETEDNKTFTPIDKGIRIFQEGVKIEKGVEGSKAAERTAYRSARRIKYRRKLRKIETLKALVQFELCPPLSTEELNNWRYKKDYPTNEAFKNWWLTDNEDSIEARRRQKKNPYYFRSLVATKKLDLRVQENRYALGRAIYHMAQRRGFLSNRLESTKESEGAVKSGIAEISNAKVDRTLGQYFYDLYKKGEKIRDHYTHRIDHYLEEFNHICKTQELPTWQIDVLRKAIFYQRPLKSQKGMIGKCPFETNKPRCAVSHPLFEEFRMLCFLNNIKIKTPTDDKLRVLNNEEREKVTPLFFRKSKPNFDFEEIAKQLAPKKQYKYFKSADKNPEDWLFNYSMKTTVSGCPVSARFNSVFGEDWKNLSIPHISGKDKKASFINIDDVWHVLMTFDSDEKLTAFATEKLKLNEEQKKEFVNIRLKQDFASLSLKAIKKILPYLRQGLIYSHSVFLANMEAVIPVNIWSDKENREIIQNEIHQIIQTQNEEKQIVDIVNGLIKRNKEIDAAWSKEAIDLYRADLLKQVKIYYGENTFGAFSLERKERIEKSAFELFSRQMQKKMGSGEFAKMQRIDDRIKSFLADQFDIAENTNKLYHPSAIETFKPVIKSEDGNYYLGSPITNSVRNPMAMRALHQLRKVVNELIKAGTIDESTTIHIEMSRDLMNSNERKALQNWQRKRENERKKYAEEIKKHFDAQGIKAEPNESEILKYQLWEEQNHICVYTGKNIGLSDFLGGGTGYDIEHTIPQSLSFDNSQVNKTLCENNFNRAVKRNKIPSELTNHELILERIADWKENFEKLNNQIAQAVRSAKGAATKEEKDKVIQKRHELTFERDYWRDKYQRFTMKDVPSGFKNSQLVDIGIITKYSRLYLQTLFNKVFTVKGSTVADFRKFWGLQDIYEKKARVNHVHHCIDAMTIACMTKPQYEKLAKFYHEWEGLREDGHDKKPAFEKPWPTFTEDVKNIENELFVSHYTPDNLSKNSKKVLRKRGKKQYDSKGNPIIQTGDSVRGSLHKETFYGAIEREVENKKGELEKVIKYVVRKKVVDLSDTDINNIVDDKVRERVAEARKSEKPLLKEIEKLRKELQKAEEHDELGIKNAIGAIEQQISELYCMPNKNGAPIPIKKVRLFQPTVTNPLSIKKQRDKKKDGLKEYKENYYAANDGNYIMAIYEGKDGKGKVLRDFELTNIMKAGEYFKKSVQSILQPQGIGGIDGLIPKVKFNGKLELLHKANIKIGTMVILWEESPEEIWDLEPNDIKKRLYKVVGLSIQRIKRPSGKIDEYATIVLRFHQEANQASDLKTFDGAFTKDEPYMGQRKLNHNQFNALIENIDFKISLLGKIEKI